MEKSIGNIPFRTAFKQSKKGYHHTVMPSDLGSENTEKPRNTEDDDEKTDNN